ncbi:hypothetical protein G6514_001010, partial [Epicoccum nigrum]
MRNLNGCRVFLLAAPAVLLLFPVSVLVLILERISKSILYQHTYRDFRSGEFMITLTGRNSTASTADSDIDVAMQIDNTPMLAILGVCLAAYIVCAIDAFGIWELKKVEGTSGHQRTWTWVAAVGNVLLAALSLGVFGWATAVQGSDGGWQSADDVNKTDREYTRETWACQIERYFPKEGWASGACGTAKATRFLLIPMAIFSLLVLVSLWVLIRQRGGLKWLCGGKGRYAGFDNVYELQQGGPPGPYAQGPPGPYVQSPYVQGSSGPYVQGPPPWAPQQYYVAQPAQHWGPPPVPQMMPQMAPQMMPQEQKTDAMA